MGNVKKYGEDEEGEEHIADAAHATPGGGSEGQDDGDEPLNRQQDRRPNTRRTENLDDIVGNFWWNLEPVPHFVFMPFTPRQKTNGTDR